MCDKAVGCGWNNLRNRCEDRPVETGTLLTGKEIQDITKSCNRCGSFCTPNGCHSINNVCYYTGDTIIPDDIECSSCYMLKSCDSLSKDRVKCEDLSCTNIVGLSCEWKNNKCVDKVEVVAPQPPFKPVASSPTEAKPIPNAPVSEAPQEPTQPTAAAETKTVTLPKVPEAAAKSSTTYDLQYASRNCILCVGYNVKCGVEECHSVNGLCYLNGYVNADRSVCDVCSNIKDCGILDYDKEKCEDLRCTSIQGLSCRWDEELKECKITKGLQKKARCDICGLGVFDNCNPPECNNLMENGELCYFTKGGLARAMPRCYSCINAKRCSDFAYNQEMCTNTECTSVSGLSCKWIYEGGAGRCVDKK